MQKISGDEPIYDEVGSWNNDTYCDSHNQYDINILTSLLSEEGIKKVAILMLFITKITREHWENIWILFGRSLKRKRKGKVKMMFGGILEVFVSTFMNNQ